MWTDFSKYILLFFVYGFLGWCVEVAFAACKHGRFVNRGFLNGPICPIYGFGVMLVVVLLKPLHENIVLLYIGSFLLTTAIEFLTGFLPEKIFHAKWWDYSGVPLNICGYVCLLFSLIWGAACLIVVRYVHPVVFRMIDITPLLVRTIVDGLLALLLITDLLATLAAIRSLSNRLRLLSEIAGEIHSLSDRIGENIADHTMDAKGHLEHTRLEVKLAEAEARDAVDRTCSAVHADFIDFQRQLDSLHEQSHAQLIHLRDRARELITQKHVSQQRILDAFPNLQSKRYPDAVRHIRAYNNRSKK